MRVLFLDIDGVLNSHQSVIMFYRKGKYNEMCPICMSNLNELLDSIKDLRIVISSTWRLGRTLDSLKETFVEYGFESPDKIIDTTPSLDGYRGIEIDVWLRKHNKVKEFVILDDDGDMKPHMERLIRTNPKVGFDWIALDRVLDLFSVKRPSGICL